MSNNDLAKLFVYIIGIMLLILFILIFILVMLSVKSKRPKKSEDKEKTHENKKSKIQESYNVQSISKFMEFDKIEDNMIIQKQGKRFVMIVKCQGINYDLMSGVEKNSVEQGFIQYLNTLRYPIQIYVQTRTVDLTGSINTYKSKVRKLGDNLAQKEFSYNQNVRSGMYSNEELAKQNFEVLKSRNLYEYGMDIVNNTERMSLNRNILSKQYYVILSYFPEEANDSVYSLDEVRNIAFSELYTRCQSTISLLSVCGITGKILDSFELADLLYNSYNRDEAELYDLKKAINAGYDNMYITAPDVLEKRMKELDRQIEADAIDKANDAVAKVRYDMEKERKVRQKEAEYQDIVARMARELLQENQDILGYETTRRSMEEIDKQEESSKEEKSDEQKKPKRAGRPKKTA